MLPSRGSPASPLSLTFYLFSFFCFFNLFYLSLGIFHSSTQPAQVGSRVAFLVCFWCQLKMVLVSTRRQISRITCPGRLESCLSTLFTSFTLLTLSLFRSFTLSLNLSTGRLESCLSTLTPLPPLPSHTDGAHKCQLGELGQVGSCKIKYQETILSQESSELSRRHSSPCCFSLSHLQPLILMLKVKAPTFSWRPRSRTVKII